MRLDIQVVNKLERILEEELSLYVEYLALLAKEQACVISLKADEVSYLSLQRASIVDRLVELGDTRARLIERQTGGEVKRLSEVVEQGCGSSDKKRLLMLISKIRDSLRMVEEKSREFNQVINFSLGLVNGEISLLWSASQSVTRVYDAFGSLREAPQPAAPRAGSSLGEA